jgi:hypothetical protein
MGIISYNVVLLALRAWLGPLHHPIFNLVGRASHVPHKHLLVQDLHSLCACDIIHKRTLVLPGNGPEICDNFDKRMERVLKWDRCCAALQPAHIPHISRQDTLRLVTAVAGPAAVHK